MSVLEKKWEISNNDQSKNIIEKILENRGLIDREEIDAFLKVNFKKGFHNPFLMKDMDKAVKRINKAINSPQRIMIFGDYDVDGISGTAILYHTLKLLGAKVSCRLPHRVDDGYGLNEHFIQEFKEVNVDLLITVDCGISCRDQIAMAQKEGIDVIITDHHTIPKLFPENAYAILHPQQPSCQYPFKGLTGAGVAFKLATALLTDRLNPEEKNKYLYTILDIASLGTVADLGPLVGENRVIVKHGLQALQETKWQGLNYLKQCAGLEPGAKLDINTIGYVLSPRINAAGRISSPYYALQLLLYNKPDEKGKILAEQLDKLNQLRQRMVADALEELGTEEFSKENVHNDKIFIAWSANWHVGILGLLASKYVEKFSYPCIVMHDFGDHLVGSGRSPEYFDLVKALGKHKDLLSHFGGHVQAAGFSIKKKNVEEFVRAMKKYAAKELSEVVHQPTLNIDCELSEEDIGEGLISFLEKMEPYGISNTQPVFLIRNVTPTEIRQVGKELQHLHFKAITGTKSFPVIGFRMGEFCNYLRDHNRIDLVCHLEKNEWKGTTKIQFRALDVAATENET